MSNKITEKKEQEIIELTLKGIRQEDIVKITGVSRSCVQRVIKRNNFIYKADFIQYILNNVKLNARDITVGVKAENLINGKY